MKEQIEKIFNDVVEAEQRYHEYCLANTCHDCEYYGDGECDNHIRAEHLYNAGYRKQEWISVEDRLPENDHGKHWKERQHYLVITEPSGLMRVARFGNKEFPWWIDSHDTVMTSANYAKVTHWMPLPEPPKAKGGAE